MSDIKNLLLEIQDYNSLIIQKLDLIKELFKSNKKQKGTIEKLEQVYNSIVDTPKIEYTTKIKQVKQSRKNKIPPVIEKLRTPIKKLEQVYNSIVDKPTEMMTIFEKLEEPEKYDIKEVLDLINKVQNTKINKKIDTNIINKQIEEIEKMKPIKEKKPKTAYDPKKIEANKKLINEYTFNDKMSNRFLTDGAKHLFKLQKKRGTDDDVSEFSIVYLQKEPSPKELIQLRKILRIK